MIQKIQFKTNCVITVNSITSIYKSVVSTKQSRVRNRLFQVKLSSFPRLIARHTTSCLNLKTVVAEAEAVENNSKITREYGISESMVRRLTGRLNCQQNGRRWDASHRSIRSSIKEYWNSLQSREAKVSFLSSIDFVF